MHVCMCKSLWCLVWVSVHMWSVGYACGCWSPLSTQPISDIITVQRDAQVSTAPAALSPSFSSSFENPGVSIRCE